jgi:hypothetical protein
MIALMPTLLGSGSSVLNQLQDFQNDIFEDSVDLARRHILVVPPNLQGSVVFESDNRKTVLHYRQIRPGEAAFDLALSVNMLIARDMF